eukprot:11410122-Prorocentrum_lima.AAC.1
MADARVGDARAMTGHIDKSLDNALFARMVLVGTDANHVVRPRSADWWNAIVVEREIGRPVTLKLAGGVATQGAMT